MRETLFILAVIFILAGFTAFRYRKQLAGMIAFWRALKKMRAELRQAGEKQINDVRKPVEGKLVNCSKCRIWLPEQNAIKLGDKLYFCSAKCLEKNVKTT